jgi:hypothetical protein
MLMLSNIIVMNLDVVEESPDELIEEVNSIGNPYMFLMKQFRHLYWGILHWKGR